MPPRRVFLPCDHPCLPQAARWLRDAAGGAPCGVELSGTLVVVPGRRAGRRLLELLVEACQGQEFVPPQIITPGELPEKLYTPPRPLADDVQSRFAWLTALRVLDRELLERILPHPPAESDLAAWLALGRDLRRVIEPLANDNLTPGDVPMCCRGLADFEDGRWEALDALRAAHEAALAGVGLVDVHAARREAIHQRRLAAPGPIVLVGTVDLPRGLRTMLAQVDEHATALVHAAETEAAGFDEIGCLVPEQWMRRRLDLDDAALSMVDRPRDQAHEAIRILAAPPTGNGKPLLQQYALDQITIGVADETLAPLVSRALELAELPGHVAAGRDLRRTGPVLLLAALRQYLARRTFTELAELVRHPDFEAFLDAELATGGGKPWLILLDRYISEHVQRRPGETWLGNEQRAAQLRAVHDAVLSLLPVEHAQHKPLPAWAAPLTQVLQRVYGHRDLDQTDGRDWLMARALKAIAEALHGLARLDSAGPITPRVTFEDALALLLDLLGEQHIPQEPDTPAIEVLSWLELPMDDAPVLLLLGVNEGRLPQSASSDAYLPDSTRRALGLLDNQRRYARDLYWLTTVLRSRPTARLVCGRRTAEGDPAAPSRLVLACPPEAMAQRVLRFYDESPAPRPAPLLLKPGSASTFFVPPPEYPLPGAPAQGPVRTLRVTAFRDYLSCPYRFYLRHVRRLEVLEDRAVELDSLAFGNLAHDVLRAFAGSDLTACTVAERIASFMADQIQCIARQRYGAKPPVAVTIQQEQLRQRLETLAHWQVRQVQEGWRIVEWGSEVELSTDVLIAGESYTIKGRIDRIDVHETLGYRLMDYKTSETAKHPEKVHRNRDGQWLDLQLPLYHKLAGARGVCDPIALGYIQLSKTAEQIGLDICDWTPEIIESGWQEAQRVLRLVGAGVFWPPKYPVDFFSEYAGICMDRCPTRDGALQKGHEWLAALREGMGATGGLPASVLPARLSPSTGGQAASGTPHKGPAR